MGERRESCATCIYWLVPDRTYFEGHCQNPESPFNGEYLHRNDGCQKYLAMDEPKPESAV